MRPYCRAVLFTLLFAGMPSLIQAAECQPKWHYWKNGQIIASFPDANGKLTTTLNADKDAEGNLIPWCATEVTNIYFSGGGWKIGWAYKTDGLQGVQYPWFYADNYGNVNGVANGFTTDEFIPPINGYTQLADNQDWIALKTIPVYVSGPRLGSKYENKPVASEQPITPTNPIINTQPVAPKSIAAVQGSAYVPAIYYGGSFETVQGICALDYEKVNCTNASYPSFDEVLPSSYAIESGGDLLCGLQTNSTVRCTRPFFKSGDTPGLAILGQGASWVKVDGFQPGPAVQGVVQVVIQKNPYDSYGPSICLLMKDGSVRCDRVTDLFDKTVAFQGPAVQLAAADNAVCARLKSGAVQCADFANPPITVIAGGATDLAASKGHFCAIVDSVAQCWMTSTKYLNQGYVLEASLPQVSTVLNPATTLLASNYLICAPSNQTVNCIDPYVGLATKAPFPAVIKGFSDITSTFSGWNLADSVTCIQAGPVVRCWGNPPIYSPNIMGSFENVNGTPACAGGYAYCQTNLGLGFGKLVVDSDFNSSTMSCKAYATATPSDYISCSSGKPTVAWPSATCSNATDKLPSCEFGSIRCDSTGSAVCGGVLKDKSYDPYLPICKQGLATCAKDTYYGVPSCLVDDPYSANTGKMGCADIYGQPKYNGKLSCDASGQATCGWSSKGDAKYALYCPSSPTSSDVPTCGIIPGCGNGILESGEECDDGNYSNYDGCSGYCKKESTSPPVDPYASPAVCGNGKLESGEGCDDGNTVGGDGCTATCIKEVTPQPKEGSTTLAPKVGQYCDPQGGGQIGGPYGCPNDGNPCNGIEYCTYKNSLCIAPAASEEQLAGWTCTGPPLPKDGYNP